MTRKSLGMSGYSGRSETMITKLRSKLDFVVFCYSEKSLIDYEATVLPVLREKTQRLHFLNAVNLDFKIDKSGNPKIGYPVTDFAVNSTECGFISGFFHTFDNYLIFWKRKKPKN